MKQYLTGLFCLIFATLAHGQILDSYKYPGKLSPIPRYYGAALIQYHPYVPFQVGTLRDAGDLVWYKPSEPVYGIRITEYGEFFLNKIFPAFVTESSRPDELDYVYSDRWFDYYRRTKGEPAVTLAPSPAGSYIEYFRSREFSRFYMTLLYLTDDNTTLGLGFGTSKIRNAQYKNGASDGQMEGEFLQQMSKFTTGSWVSNGGNYVHFDGIVSWNLDTRFLGTFKFTHNITAQSILGVTKELRTLMQTMGFWSTIGVSATRSLGPIRFGAQIVSPTRFVVVPTYYKASTISFSAGLAF